MELDTLYDLALQYRKTKLWKKLYDDRVFAVKFSDGQIGYCCVMGLLGEQIALAVYIGAEGFDSYQRIADMDLVEHTRDALQEMQLMQNCLLCSFENKDMLLPEERKEVQRYAKKYGVSFRGRKSFPQFTKYQPFRYPWNVNEQEMAYLGQALSAAIEVAKQMETKDLRELGLSRRSKAGDVAPLLTDSEDGFVWGTTVLPQPIAREYPSPTLDEFTVARLKGVERKGTWECKLLRIYQPLQVEENEAPYFPLMLLSMDRASQYVMVGDLVTDYEDNAAQALTRLIQDMADHFVPRTIWVCDNRTEALLKPLCAQLGIKMQRRTGLPDLDQVAQGMMRQLNKEDALDSLPQDEMNEMFDMLMHMNLNDLRSMPKDLANELMEMDRMGMLPVPLSRKLRSVFGTR